MTRRLKEDWFHQYMLDPQQYRRGTRMPAAWPMGQVLLKNVLDGKAMTQINSVWVFLSDGDKAPMPLGLGPNPIELVAVDQPIIYRNFIQGAGPRAIGVGYPEKVNLAFDANNLRLALLWHNAFIDASKHWVGRGAGFQVPLGDNVLRLPDGVSFAALDDATALWPTQSAKKLGYQFRGYRFDDSRRPVFLYDVAGVTVEDAIAPVSNQEFTPIRRTLRLSGRSPTRIWYRAAVGDKIEPLDAGWYAIDGDWKTRISTSDSEGRLRKNGNKMELIVAIDLGARPTTITHEYSW